MADIFISYKSERRAAARHLSKVLRHNGYSVWYDYGLIAGDDFEPQLMQELEAATVVVVLWCRLAVASGWVVKEARFARDHKKYAPCWIETCALPAEFAGGHTLDLSDWSGAPRDHHLDPLLDAVSRRVGRAPRSDWSALRELDEDWRTLGGLSLAQFALGAGVAPEPTGSPPVLGEPPAGLSAEMLRRWRLAQSGDAKAQADLGFDYQEGRGGLPKSHEKAVRLYRLAAEKGDAAGQAGLGKIYDEGWGGLPRDDAEAVRLYRLAAEQGDARGQTNLGFMYGEGRGGLPQDDAEAVRLFRLAAEQGDAGGQRNLGFMYAKGRGGLPQDDAEAVRLYRLAAEQGDALGQRNLGFMYTKGRGGLPLDDAEAVRLYRLAAEQGDAFGQNNLGVMYENGRGGLRKDRGEAIRLYRLAAEQGDEYAQKALKRLGVA